jgi:transposase
MLEDILTQGLLGGKGSGWEIIDAYYERITNEIIVLLEPTRQAARCSCCGALVSKALDVKKKQRRWRHLDAWNIRTMVFAPLRRVRCRRCGVRVEAVPWARPGGRMTRPMEEEILSRARDCSIQGVSRQLDVHWTTVMRLMEKRVMEVADKRFRRPLRRIGVDEVSYGKGHNKYLTLVWDHDQGQVVWIARGREQETLEAFFRKLGPRRSHNLKCVTMDMAHGYINAAREHAPQADIVFDRFHIERHLTDAVNEVRKQEFWRHEGRWREVIRGKKFLLLKKRRRLHWRHRPELDAVLRLNRRLNSAYVLKEQFDLVWRFRIRSHMADELQRWHRMLRWKRLKPLQNFWKMIEHHMDGVLAWSRHRLTNAPLEGNNARIRGISQRGHGYRNPENLMVVIYHSSWR